MEIRVMARQGRGVRAIARQLGCSRNTVRATCVSERQRGTGRAQPRRVQARRLQGLPARADRAGPAALDTGDGAAARDSGARLRGRHQPAEGVASRRLKKTRAPSRWCASRPPPGKQMQADFTMCGAGATRCWRWWPRWATAAPAS